MRLFYQNKVIIVLKCSIFYSYSAHNNRLLFEFIIPKSNQRSSVTYLCKLALLYSSERLSTPLGQDAINIGWHAGQATEGSNRFSKHTVSIQKRAKRKGTMRAVIRIFIIKDLVFKFQLKSIFLLLIAVLSLDYKAYTAV